MSEEALELRKLIDAVLNTAVEDNNIDLLNMILGFIQGQSSVKSQSIS
jgi:DNA-binding phage protein